MRTLHAVSIVAAFLAACGTDNPVGTEGPLGLAVMAGSEQLRWPGAELIRPLKVQAVDAEGVPVRQAEVPVSWAVLTGAGTVIAETEVTDESGRVLARWTLGPDEGTQTVEARAQGEGFATFSARAAKPGPLLFVSDRESTYHVQNLFVMNEDGSDVMQITDGVEDIGFASWSPDGSQIVASRGLYGGGTVIIMDADGSNERVLQHTGGGEAWYPSWSPDGLHLAVGLDGGGTNCGSNIHVIDLVGSMQRQLTFGCDQGNGGSDWSPDGNRIVFMSTRVGAGQFRIYTIDADGGEEVLLSGNHRDTDPAWSSDGTRIAFARDRKEIWVMNPDGSNAEPLFQGDSTGAWETVWIGEPVWSPDDSRIVFTSLVGGAAVIFVLDVATGETTELTVWRGDVWNFGGWWRPVVN